MEHLLKDEELLSQEHNAGFHTSEDWDNLKDRCSQCYNICASRKVLNFISKDWREMLGTSPAQGRADDAMRSFTHNPLER